MALAALGMLAFAAATPAPSATPYRIDITKIQPKSLLPTVPLHTEYVVLTNKMGQVTRVTSGKLSKNRVYNIQTMGNALQAFIRTEEGGAIAGKYRLTYDYNPKTTRIHRDVAFLQANDIDANAEGAANRMMDIAEKQKPPAAAKPTVVPKPAPTTSGEPKPVPTIDNRRLPDLPQIMHSPPP